MSETSSDRQVAPGIDLCDADFNMRKCFYLESKEWAKKQQEEEEDETD